MTPESKRKLNIIGARVVEYTLLWLFSAIGILASAIVLAFAVNIFRTIAGL